MTESPIDRRVARTRKRLQDALISLTPERGYDAITVEEICAEADVGRSTFYAHYAGKDALRDATTEAHVRAIRAEILSTDKDLAARRFRFSGPMLVHANALRPLHRALLLGGGAMHDHLRERIVEAVRAELAEETRVPGQGPDEVQVHYVAGAFLSVLTWWIRTESELAPDQIDAMFQQLASGGIPHE